MMRAGALAAVVVAAALASLSTAHAGAQRYEPLAESVRGRMSAAIADKSAPELAFRVREEGHKWMLEMSRRLERRVADRKQRLELLRTVHFEAVRAGLDPQLVLGVIEVESNFRKYAVSRSGARGYMQVMPFWTKLIGAREHNLFHLRTNLRYGCLILRHYLDIENGDYFRALGRYNGSLGKPDYPRAVLAAWKVRWGYKGVTS
jgi:soluble lytic murein transglycosylase-like protein